MAERVGGVGGSFRRLGPGPSIARIQLQKAPERAHEAECEASVMDHSCTDDLERSRQHSQATYSIRPRQRRPLPLVSRWPRLACVVLSIAAITEVRKVEVPGGVRFVMKVPAAVRHQFRSRRW